MSNFRVEVNSMWVMLSLLLVTSISIMGGEAHALECHGCHGTTGTTNDMRPLDDPSERNTETGGFQGSHRKHILLDATATPNTCATCHGGSVTGYTSSHRDGNIKLSSSMNGSPTFTTYTSIGAFSPHTSAWSQRTTPILGSCNNVNCHFEKTTPTWGFKNFTTSTSNCNACHGAPPKDGHHPGKTTTDGNDKHGDYLGTDINSCTYCHANHVTDANGGPEFYHATSASRRTLIVKFTRSPNNGGTYGANGTGDVSYPHYLPSYYTQHTEKKRDGTCTDTYCHSNAAGGPPKMALTWSDNRSSQCFSCHGGRIDDNTKTNCDAIGGTWMNVNSADGSGKLIGVCSPYVNMTSNGHGRLVGPRWIRQYACSNCHSATVTPMLHNMTSGSKIYDGALIQANHVNGTKNIAIAPYWSMSSIGKKFLYSPISTATTKAKTCYNVYCHSDGTNDSKTVARPYSWTQGRTSCSSCHGHPDGTCDSCHDGVTQFVVNGVSKLLTPNPTWPPGEGWRAAMPMYQNEGAGKSHANSHTKHVSENFTCDNCHNATVTSGNCVTCHTSFSGGNSMTEVAHINPDKHVNGVKDVVFPLQSSTHTRAQYTLLGKTCVGTPADGCHGGNADPQWGGSINATSTICIDCHGSASDQDNLSFTKFSQSKLNLDEWNTSGHGRPLSKGLYPESNNRPANFVTNPCWYCHDAGIQHTYSSVSPTNPYRLLQHQQFKNRFDKECVYCHMQGGTNSECIDCHNITESIAPQLANISTVRLVAWANRTAMVLRPDHRSFDRTKSATNCLTNQATKCHSGDAWTHNTGPNTIGTWSDEMKTDVKNQYVQMGVCLQCHDDDTNNKCTQCHTPPANNPNKYALGFQVDAIFIKPSSARATSAHFGRMHYNDFTNTGGWSKIKSNLKSPAFGRYSTYTGTWKGGKFCWNCHDPHGDSNIYMIHDQVTTQTDSTYGYPVKRAKVVFTKRANGTDFITYTNNAYTGICNVCHSADGTNGAKHHKQGSSDSHNTGRICTDCHEHKFSDSHGGKTNGVKNPCSMCHLNRPVPRHSAFGLPRDCTKCHAGIILNRMDVMRQFGAKSHHVQGVAVSNEHCYQCHWESTKLGLIDNARHTGFNFNNYSTVSGDYVQLVKWGAGVRPTFYSSTSVIKFLARNIGTANERAEAAKVSNHCLGCHSDQNNDVSPFQDCKVPRQYAWDGQSIAARYSQLGTVAWGKYATNGKSGVVKAFSAHGNATANQGGWDPNTAYDGVVPNTRAATNNIQCYDCHSSHGSNVTGTTTSYMTFNGTHNGGNLKETQAYKGGYSMTYQASKNTTPGAVNPYNAGAGQCFDCHMTPTSTGATPWGYTTFGAGITKPIKGYRDGFKFGDRGDNGFPADTFKMTANPMKKGRSTSIVGGHLKAETQLNYSTSAKNKINGLCTPCHDPHGVSPTLGTNQQYAVPLLKGTWMTSPYKEDQPPLLPVARANGKGPKPTATGGTWGSPLTEGGYNNNAPNPGTEPPSRINLDRNTFGAGNYVKESDQTFAGLCLRCHTQDKLILKNVTSPTWKSQDRIHRTVKGWGKNKEHSFTCSKCHQPHNSKLPRLMQTNCLDFSHRGNLNSGGIPNRAIYQRSDVASWADEHRGYPEANLNGRYVDSDQACHANARKNSGNNWSNYPTTMPDYQRWNSKSPW